MNETQTEIISARIMVLVAGGMTLVDAFNSVVGAGAFEKLAGEVYDALTTRNNYI
jgi:hypothetical protein